MLLIDIHAYVAAAVAKIAEIKGMTAARLLKKLPMSFTAITSDYSLNI